MNNSNIPLVTEKDLEFFQDFVLRCLENQSKIMVGTLLKKIEVLENQGLTNSQFVSLSKLLIKENIYENFRSLKNLVNNFSLIKFNNSEDK